MSQRRTGLLGAVLAAVGLAIALYLASTKLAGGLPVCGPIKGCEDVALSPYSELFGIPVAVFGALFSAVVLVLWLILLRTGDRRTVLAAYGLGLFGILFAAYLTYLELFVVHAICVWCVGYALTVVLGWIVAAWGLRGGGAGGG